MASGDRQIRNGDFLDRYSSGTRHAIALFLLMVLPVILFFPTVLGDQQFMGHDTVQWRAGAESIFDYRDRHEGEEPLWASNMFAGMPAYTVHVFKSVPHLDNMVFDQLRMIWPAIPYWVLLCGLYLFFTLIGFRPLTAALGALLFGLTTYMPIIIGAGHNIKFIAYSYLPWMLSGYWLITRTDRRWLGFFLFAVASTLEFRAGHPQVTYYFVYLFAALFLWDSWRFYSRGKQVELGRVTVMIAAATILGLLGTAEQYWRLLEYSPHSIRGGSAIADQTSGGLGLDYAFSWSQGILESLTLIIPNLYGGSSAMAYWGEKPGTSGPHYFGAIAFLLFLTGLIRSHRNLRYLFAGTGLLGMTFAWGYHFPLNELWFRILPGFDKFRTPEMWLTLTVFCFTVVSLFGVEYIVRLARDRSSELKEKMRNLALPAGITLGLGLILLIGGPALLSFESEREREQIARQIGQQNNLPTDNRQVQQRTNQIIATELKPERVNMARSDTIRYLILSGAALTFIYFLFTGSIGVGTLLLALFLITSFDLLAVGQRYISDNSMVDRNLELTQVIERQATPADRFVADRVRNDEPYPYRALPLDDNPFNNAVPSYFYPSIGGYSGAKLSLFQDVIDEGLFTGPEGINRSLLNMLNVRFITARRSLPLEDHDLVFQENDFHVYENRNVLPKAWFVDQIRTVDTPREAFNAILPQNGFDPASEGILETRQAPEVAIDPDSDVTVARWTDRRITLEIERSEPGFLVLSEIYYPPGWQAELNGEPIGIYKTNYLLRGFAIPEGSHTLRVEFHPRSHIQGSRISWASNLIQWGIGLWLLVGWVRMRRSSTSSRHES